MIMPHAHSDLSNVLEKLRTLGGEVSTDGERLTLKFPEEAGREVEPLLAELRERKAEVLTLLAADKCRIRDRELGLEKMRQAWQRISDLWDEIESSGGSVAWEWILRASPHGPKIRAAEDRVNAIGSQGDPAALVAACDALVNAWREGIEGWERANGRSKAKQASFDLDRIEQSTSRMRLT